MQLKQTHSPKKTTGDYWSLLEITGENNAQSYTHSQTNVSPDENNLGMRLVGCILWFWFGGVQLWVSPNNSPNVSVETLGKVGRGQVIPSLSCECDEYHKQANGSCVLYVCVCV